MSIVDQLLAPLRFGKKRASDKAGSVFAVMTQDEMYREPGYEVIQNQGRAYKESEITYFCIKQKAKTASSYKFFVSKRVKGEEGLEGVPNHPLELLIQRPNQTMHLTTQDLWMSTISYMCITGNAYWYLGFDGGEAGQPSYIIPLRPDRVKIVPDATNYIKRYEYASVSTDPVILEPWEVVHFKNFHPLSDLYGLSDIEASRYALEGDINSSKEYNSSLRNRGVPAMVVSSKRTVNKGAWDQFKREWRKEYSGYNNSGKTAFLEGGELEVTPISVEFRDLQRFEMREYNHERLMLVHGIPPGLYSKTAIEANAMAAYRTFLRDTIRPIHVTLAEKITNDLAIPFYGEDYVCAFENCVIDDQNVKLQEMQIVANGIISAGGVRLPLLTPDEFRKLYMGLDPLDVPQPVEPTAAPTEGDRPGPEPEVEALPDDERLEEGPRDTSKVERRISKEATGIDLDKWRRIAVKEYAAGRNPAARAFYSEWIGDAERQEIVTALEQAVTLDQVKAAFEPKGVEILGKREEGLPVPSEVEVTDQDIEAAIASWMRCCRS